MQNCQVLGFLVTSIVIEEISLFEIFKMFRINQIILNARDLAALLMKFMKIQNHNVNKTLIFFLVKHILRYLENHK